MGTDNSAAGCCETQPPLWQDDNVSKGAVIGLWQACVLVARVGCWVNGCIVGGLQLGAQPTLHLRS